MLFYLFFNEKGVAVGTSQQLNSDTRDVDDECFVFGHTSIFFIVIFFLITGRIFAFCASCHMTSPSLSHKNVDRTKFKLVEGVFIYCPERSIARRM